MTNEKNARRPEGSTSATTLKRKFKRIHIGLLAEWVTIAVVCGALLLIGVAR